MRPSTLLATLATTTLTTARLTGLATPSTLAPSSPFTITLITENYIQSVADISVAWSYSLSGFPSTHGQFAQSTYLGPSKSNQQDNVTIETTAPAGLETWMGKEVVLSASLFSLYGRSASPSVANFNVTVVVGEEGSGNGDVVRSEGFTWGTGQC